MRVVSGRRGVCVRQWTARGVEERWLLVVTEEQNGSVAVEQVGQPFGDDLSHPGQLFLDCSRVGLALSELVVRRIEGGA